MDAIKTVQEQPHAAGSERKGTVLPGALGGIIGDVCGSIYERRIRTTGNPEEIDLYNPNCRFTDDTVLTVATMEALLTDCDYAKAYRKWGRRYPDAGYGKLFQQWLHSDTMGPYGSYGNGAIMRVGPIGWACRNFAEVYEEAERSARVTHNHQDAIAAAKIVAANIYEWRLDFSGEPQPFNEWAPHVDHSLQLPPLIDVNHWDSGKFDASCRSALQVIDVVLERVHGLWDLRRGSAACDVTFEDFLKYAISICGDIGTITCVVGSLRGMQYEAEHRLIDFVRAKLPDDMLWVIDCFTELYGGLDPQCERHGAQCAPTPA